MGKHTICAVYMIFFVDMYKPKHVLNIPVPVHHLNCAQHLAFIARFQGEKTQVSQSWHKTLISLLYPGGVRPRAEQIFQAQRLKNRCKL